jgi:hypothetical protein
MIPRQMLAKVSKREKLSSWRGKAKREQTMRVLGDGREEAGKRRRDEMESDPGTGVTRCVQCRACARPPRRCLAFSMRRTGARPSLSRIRVLYSCQRHCRSDDLRARLRARTLLHPGASA